MENAASAGAGESLTLSQTAKKPTATAKKVPRTPIYIAKRQNGIDEAWKKHRVTESYSYDRSYNDYVLNRDDNYPDVSAEAMKLASNISEYIRLAHYLDQAGSQNQTFSAPIQAAINLFIEWGRNPENEGALQTMKETIRTIRYTKPFTIVDLANPAAFDAASDECTISETDAKAAVLGGCKKVYVETSFLLEQLDCYILMGNPSEYKERVITVLKKMAKSKSDFQESMLYSYIYSRYPKTRPTREQFAALLEKLLFYEAAMGWMNLYDNRINACHWDSRYGTYPEETDGRNNYRDHEEEYDSGDNYYYSDHREDYYDDECDYDEGNYDEEGEEASASVPTPSSPSSIDPSYPSYGYGYGRRISKEAKAEEERKRKFLAAAENFYAKPPKGTQPTTVYWNEHFTRQYYLSAEMEARARQAVSEVLTDLEAKYRLVDALYIWLEPSYYLSAAYVHMYEVTPSTDPYTPPSRKFLESRPMTPEEIALAYQGKLKDTPELNYWYHYCSGSYGTSNGLPPARFAKKENVPLPPNRTAEKKPIQQARANLPADWERVLSGITYKRPTPITYKRPVARPKPATAAAAAAKPAQVNTYGSASDY
jgi:hypothetical protein